MLEKFLLPVKRFVPKINNLRIIVEIKYQFCIVNIKK